MAHEVGHNLGMKHDFDEAHGGDSSSCNQDNHIMSYGSSKEKWSTCSKADFEARYLQVQSNWCMEGIEQIFCQKKIICCSKIHIIIF